MDGHFPEDLRILQQVRPFGADLLISTHQDWTTEDVQDQTAKEAWKVLTGGGACSVPVWVYSDPGRSRGRAMRALHADLGTSYFQLSLCTIMLVVDHDKRL